MSVILLLDRLQKIVAVGLIVAAASACAPSQSSRIEDRDPPENSGQTSPKDTDDPVAVAEQRRAIAADGLAADCSGYHDASGRQAWIGAWCGLYAEDWQLARIAAKRARSHFATIGELRRQIEMGLLEAIAIDRLGRSGSKQAKQAHQLWLSSKMPLHGALHDRFAGDLPYLYAQAIEQRLLHKPTTSDGHRLTRRLLLDIAWAEHQSFDRQEALPHVARASVRRHLQVGEIGRALDSLGEAFRLDRRAEREPGLRQDLALFARISEALGMADAERHVVSILAAPAENPASLDPGELDLAKLNKSSVLGHLDHPAGRARLADAIGSLRSSATLAIRPPPALMGTLREYDALDTWTADSWPLAYQSGQLLGEHGHRREASRYLHVAVESIEKMRASLPTPALRQRFFVDKRKVYMALVDTYVGRDTARRTQADYRQGLQLANALKARGLLDLLDGRIGSTLATEGDSGKWTVDPSVPSTVQRTADQVIARLESWTEAAKHATHAPTRLGDLPKTVIAKVGDKTAVLEYLISPRRSYVWVLTDGGIEMRRIAGREDLAPLIEEFIATLADTSSDTRHRKLAERLYVELVGPVEDVIKDVDHLVIAPDDLLYELPFETLARPTRQNKPRYLVRDRVVSYTPSTAVLTRLLERKRATTSSTPKALVIGAPDLDRPAVDLLGLARDLPNAGMFSLVEMFPALPGADAELASVAKRLEQQKLDVDSLTGKRAAESRLRHADLTDYDIIHLATHGVSDARGLDINASATQASNQLDFEQPALLLSRDDDEPDDGIVTLGELLNRQTAAGLVVLSGCTTGRGWHTLGDGAYGLAGALLYTGSHNVIASTWSVGDAETSKLMDAVYKKMAAGKSPAAALRMGQIESIERGETPASWAAFHLVGGL